MQPVAFQFGPFTIHWYGIFVALGFLAGVWTASRRAPYGGIGGEKILELAPWLILGGMGGGRMLFVLTHWREQFAGAPFSEVFMFTRGGLVYYGGLIGASFTFILVTQLKRMPLWKTADIMAPSIALGYAIGRVGCLLFGCCYGKVCSAAWAVRYPVGHQTHPVGSDPIPVHPTQIYDSLLNLGLYAGLAWLFRHRKFDGQVFAVYLAGYAILRSFVELFRGDYPGWQRFAGGWVTPGQMVSLAILVTGVVLLWTLSRGGSRKCGGGSIEQ